MTRQRESPPSPARRHLALLARNADGESLYADAVAIALTSDTTSRETSYATSGTYSFGVPSPSVDLCVEPHCSTTKNVPASRADEERARLPTGLARSAPRFAAGDRASAAVSDEVIAECVHELAVLRSGTPPPRLLSRDDSRAPCRCRNDYRTHGPAERARSHDIALNWCQNWCQCNCYR